MIVVTGATGQLGSLVMERLLAHVPASALAVSVRDPEKAAAIGARGVRVRRGDFADASGLHHAFEGAQTILLVSSNSSGRDVVAHHRNAIEAARDVGARRIIYTAHQATSATSSFDPMRDHAGTEAVLAEVGVPFTSLRNGFYAGSAMMFLAQGLASGTAYLPEDGPTSWTTHADLAEVAALAARGAVTWDGASPPLTAATAHTFADLCAIASEVRKTSIKRVVVSDVQFRDTLVERGVPPARADLLLGMFVASRNGEFDVTSPALADAIGHHPQTMPEVLSLSAP